MANSMADHMKRINGMAKADVAKAAARGLYKAGQLIETTAKQSITEGAVSGAAHVPSAAGQPPNEDTGALRRSIETRLSAQSTTPSVEVVAGGPTADYAVHLEYGTSRMAARPFMKPAVDKNRARVAQEVGAAVSIIIKSGGR